MQHTQTRAHACRSYKERRLFDAAWTVLLDLSMDYQYGNMSISAQILEELTDAACGTGQVVGSLQQLLAELRDTELYNYDINSHRRDPCNIATFSNHYSIGQHALSW